MLSSGVYLLQAQRHGLGRGDGELSFLASSFNWVQILRAGERGTGLSAASGRLQMCMGKKRAALLLAPYPVTLSCSGRLLRVVRIQCRG